MPNAGIYGRRQAKKFGIIFSDDAVTDGAATTIAEMGQLVIDLTDGKIAYVDSGTLTQELS